MAKLVNSNAHAAYVDHGGERLQKYAAGEIVEADGERAAQLKASGFEPAKDEDVKAWESRNDASNAPSPHQVLADRASKTRRAQQALSAAQSQVVVGDDQAPYGPPTGTVTTVQAVRQNTRDPLERAAFGENSADHRVEGDAADPALVAGGAEVSGREVHNLQAERTEEVDEVAQELAETRSEPRKQRGGRRKTTADDSAAKSE